MQLSTLKVLPVHLELMLLAGKDSAPLFTLNQTDLCHSLALLARKLCTVFLDPKGLSPFLACRLIPLNKNPGVRPIVICETSRIVAKAVLSVTRQDIQQAAGSLQLCAGQVAGIDAAIHTMSHLFNDDVNDATATGKITNLCTWWDKLVSLGPAYGYHVNASKTCLVAKQSHHAAALSAFHDTQITITAEGKPHLGAALGTFTFVQHYVKRKVEGWAQELNQLASIAANNPHAAYAAFTHGLSSRWIFLARAIPNIRHLMQPLEDIIRSKLIPNLTGRSAPFDTERELYSLPARLGGMGLINPSTLSQSEFHSSSLISQPLVSNILSHNYDYNEETLTEQQKSIKEVVKMKLNRNNTAATQLRAMLPSNLQLAMDLCQEKGASSWRTVLPIEEHNEIRDYTAYLLSEICHNVSTEPHLQPITELTMVTVITPTLGHCEATPASAYSQYDISTTQNPSWTWRLLYGYTALMIASREGRDECVKLLLDKGASAHLFDKYGYTALMMASREGRVKCVKLLLDKGASADLSDKDGKTALMIASREGRDECVKLLLDKGASAHLFDKYGYTALMMASREGRVKCVKLLLDKGASADLSDKDGKTALMLASSEGRVECVKLLLDKGASADLLDENGQTALRMASFNNRVECVRLLLDKGANFKIQDNKSGWTALIAASSNNSVECVTLLLKHGAAVDHEDKDGHTALITASWKGHEECIEELLKCGAKVDHEDKDGNTALHLAAKKGHGPCVELLLSAPGIDANRVNHKGQTPLMLTTDDKINTMLQKRTTLV
eukprot:Em0003g776a